MAAGEHGVRELETMLEDVRRLLEAGAPGDAAGPSRDAVELARRHAAEPGGRLGLALALAATAHGQAGDLEATKGFYAELAETFAGATGGEELVRAAGAELSLADLALAARDEDEAGEHLRAAWVQRERLATSDPNAAGFLALESGPRLARLALAQRDSAAALDWARQTLQAVGAELRETQLIPLVRDVALVLGGNDRVELGASLLDELARFAAAALEPHAASDAYAALGAFLASAGWDADAFGAYREAYQARPEGTRDDDLARADLLTEAGLAADRLGEYATAARLYDATLDIRERLLPPDDPAVLNARYNVAEVARISGGELDEVTTELRAIVEALREHPQREEVKSLLGLALKNLAQARIAQEQPEEAARLVEEALGLDLGGARMRAQLLVQLGLARMDQDLPPDVLPELERLAEELGAAEGPHSEHYLWLLGSIAAMLPDDESDRAQQLYDEISSSIGEPKTGGARDVLTAALVNLAARRWALEDHAGALEAFRQALVHVEDARAETWRVRSALETEPHEPTPIASPVVELVARHLAADDDARRFAFRVGTAAKRVQAEALRRQRELVLKGQPELLDLQALAARLRVRAVTDEANAKGGDALDVAELERLEELESLLARSVPRQALLDVFDSSNVEAVSDALPGGSTLVEYLRCRAFSTGRTRGQRSVGRANDWYVAFVLPEGSPEQLAIVDLGDAAPIDEAVLALRAAIPGAGRGRAGDGSPTATAPGWREPARSAAELVWDPLVHLLELDAPVVVAPDGQLGALPFDALITENGQPLLTQRAITLLATGRDAELLGTRPNWRSAGPVVIGEPEFGEPWAPFEPLPGTRNEANRVGTLLEVTPTLGEEATRELLLAVEDPEILHLATHGYYLPPARTDSPLGPDLAALAAEHPLVSTGIALAGANRRVETSDELTGVASALDILGLRLYGTDLAVLSACESGLGPLDDGEGLLSLARSFFLAGARTVVWTLWRVDDWATADLMERFYRRLLRETPRATALHRSKRELHARHPEKPELWAGFALQGDPEALLRYRFTMVPNDQIVEEAATTEGRAHYLDTRGRLFSSFAVPMGDAEPLKFASINARNLTLALVEDGRAAGLAAFHAGKYDEAREHFLEALERLGENPKAGRPLAAALRSHLAITAGLARRAEEALEYGLAALAAYEELEDWPMELAAVLDNVAAAEAQLGRLAEARTRYERALAIKQDEHPGGHPSIDFTLQRLQELAAWESEP